MKEIVFSKFCDFQLMLKEPQKFSMSKFFSFFEIQSQKLTLWDLGDIKRNKVRNFGIISPDYVTVADRSMVGGS